MNHEAEPQREERIMGGRNPNSEFLNNRLFTTPKAKAV
jgi:hypothetical protein